MQFLSPLYAIFLLCVIGVYWSARSTWLRSWLIFLASLVFYASLQAQYIPLLLVATVINYWLGRALGVPPDWRIEDWQFAQADWNQRRLRVLCAGIFLNILLLIGFKYVPFVFGTIGEVFDIPTIQQTANWTDIHLIAPLGLSFFSFECIAYLVDVYRGAPAAQGFLDFAAYKLFFAKLISGPITRYHPFVGQLQAVQVPQLPQITEGLWLIACGAIKKGLVADRLNVLVNLSFDNIQRAGSADLWLAVIAYGFQLYLDFSGYVDVARGSALLLGIELPENFNFPYLTTSLADFWRRWHMTLGDWLRNYLYFPLGGSRRGLFRTCLNLLIVMTIAGIWHGAAWGFLAWGVIHGIGLAIHRLNVAIAKQFTWIAAAWSSLPGLLVGWALTQALVFTSWIFFRLPNVDSALKVVQRLWGYSADVQYAQKVYVEAVGLNPSQIVIVLSAIALIMLFTYLLQRSLKLNLTWHLKLLLVPLCWYVVWQLAPEAGTQYIYFDF
jgi:alginate O-acetyltransferase complex protein AlgI